VERSDGKGEAQMFRSVLVGIDGSPTARHALLKASQLASLAGAEVHLVTAYQKTATLIALAPEALIGAGVAIGSVDSALQERAEKIVADAAADLRKEGLSVQTYAVEGEPSDAIIDVAETAKADVIVVGSKGLRGTKRLILGSVPNRVAHQASCDVLIVHTT
jgi:nucleotide-binding universal stress UspA family protein